jgi:predicted nucleotidyltransferase
VRILSVNYDSLLEALKKAAGLIRKRYPEVTGILLFGSFARGNYTPESDIDILITVKDTALPFLERQDMFVEFFAEMPFDVNILVYTGEEAAKMLDDENPLLKDAMAESLEL